jgi:hypothetical protein
LPKPKKKRRKQKNKLKQDRNQNREQEMNEMNQVKVQNRKTHLTGRDKGQDTGTEADLSDGHNDLNESRTPD